MRHRGILALGALVLVLVALDWSSTPPNPYQAPDPMAWGSADGASGALCSFTGQ